MIIIPKRISIEISTSCNLACEMCFLTGFRQRKIMKEDNYLNKFFDVGLFKELADELSESHFFNKKSLPFSLIFTGGESLLHPQIFELLEYARKKNIGATLFTNGTLIENAQIVEKIIQTMPEALMFSIEGPEKIHDKVRGEGNFRKTCKAINLIQSQKRLSGLRKPSVFIHTVISSLNIEYLEYVVSLAESLNVSGVSFSYVQWSNSKLNLLVEDELEKRLKWSGSLSKMIEAIENNLSMEREKVEKLIEQIKLIKEKHRYNYSLRTSFMPSISFIPDLNSEEIRLWYSCEYSKINFCSWLFDWIRIGVNGDVQPICAVIPFSFGNLKNQSLQEILKGEQMRNFFNEIKNNGYFYACQRCCHRPNESSSISTINTR